MANPEHLAILRRGVEQWNRWRKEHPDVRPDLTEADLERACLWEADFHLADLSRAKLREADLEKARLYEVDLSWADLRDANVSESNLGGSTLYDANLGEANLRGAYLGGTRLNGACLAGANLRRAKLPRTNLHSADLTGADFTEALAGRTIFANVDLSVASGLESIRHKGPSTVGTDTIYKSRGKIPEVFLRGCGVPEEFIEFARSIGRNPIEFYSCFISYSHKDKPFARRLHDALQGRGVRCWLDEKQMLPGDDIYEQVDRGIRLWDKVLLCGCPRFAPVLWALTWAEGGTR